MMDGDDIDAGTEIVAEASKESESIALLANRFQSTAELEAWLIDAAVAQWQHLFGQRTYYPGWNGGGPIVVDGPVFFGGDVDARIFVANDAALTSAAPTSSTNVQVAGVDEADLVETDGEHIYILTGRDLVIVKAGIGDDLRIVSSTRLDQRPSGMYLSGNRLTLVSSNAGSYDSRPLAIFAPGEPTSETEFRPPTTTVTVMNITDRAAPTVVQKTELDGQIVTSRVVDGQLRLVLTNHIQLPSPIARPIATANEPPPVDKQPPIGIQIGAPIAGDAIWWPGETGTQYMYETKDEYVARVRGTIIDSISPDVRELAADGSVISETPLFAPTDLTRPESLFVRQVATVATFDVTSNDAGPVATASVMTTGTAQVYSTADSVYLFDDQSSQWHFQVTAGAESVPTSSVWRFAVDNETHNLALAAQGEFAGALLNQFAADERDGYLRLVTKPIGWNSPGHSVHVLKETDGELAVIASIGGIAPTEDLYSVRFTEERAFFVTFRRTDPLFAIDLSDPTNPRKLGELHIPGFSDYLQPLDDNHLLAIGRGADERTGQFQELQVSIFDVTNLSDPKLLHRYSFDGGRSTATPATGNRWQRGDGDHHAVSYFADEGIFALPIYSEEAGGWGPEDTPIFAPGEGGLQVFKTDLATGFTPIGMVEHDTLIMRSVQIGERLYAISSGTVSAHELDNPNVQLGEVTIAIEQPTEMLGDLDGNGAIDADDLTVFANNFGALRGKTTSDGDIDADGDVDADDLSVFANNFGNVQITPALPGRPAVIVRRTI